MKLSPPSLSPLERGPIGTPMQERFPRGDIAPGRESIALQPAAEESASMLDWLLADQQALTAVDRFAGAHAGCRHDDAPARTRYQHLLPATPPSPGQQYAFEVNLDLCSGCKACVTACHTLNGLESGETWRSVGLLIPPPAAPVVEPARAPTLAASRHVTTACHHCLDPACLNGCPVLAYDKDPVTGIVRHLDDQCIGCQYCVMKCPYEVPQYSARLGIVRKCDLCQQRLARDEAPACASACPSEAIRISLVPTRTDTGAAANGNQGMNSSHAAASLATARWTLPDSPDPSLTHPTTVYVTRELWPSGTVAGDHGALRLEPAHWPLIGMLVLTQSAAGVFLGASALQLAGVSAGTPGLRAGGFALLAAGLVAAFCHLGRPLKAWRSFLGWRRSWLSREILLFQSFAAAAGATLLLPQLQGLSALETGSVHAAAALGLVSVGASAMVYIDTRRPWWAARSCLGNFLGTTLLLGATLTALWMALAPGAARGSTAAVLAALGIRTGLFVWRQAGLRRALRSPGSPVHPGAALIAARLPWASCTAAWLFTISTGAGLLALADASGMTAWWAVVAALSTFAAEILGRYLFFAAAGAKRMPGGIVA